MANLQNFQKESIQDLLEIDNGINRLFQILVSTYNYSPNYLSEKDWSVFYKVLKVQEEVQSELFNKVKTLISDFDFQERIDIV